MAAGGFGSILGRFEGGWGRFLDTGSGVGEGDRGRGGYF